MTAITRKEFLIEHLDCADCIARIEQHVSGLANVAEASFNAATRLLSVTLRDAGGPKPVLDEIQAIVASVEPDALAREHPPIEQGDQKIWLLEGLDCANCAFKIEQAVRGTDGVRRASVDFTSKTLTFEIQGRADPQQVMAHVRQAALDAEPDIQIIDTKRRDWAHSEEKTPRRTLVRLLAGAAIFFVALLVKLDFPFELSLYLASYLLVGGPVLLRAGKNMLRGQLFDEHFLMSLATIGALAIREFPEAVAVMLFYEVGELFESRAVGHARHAIRALLDIRPDYANLKSDQGLLRVAPERVGVGDQIVVKPGEKVPLDGRVTEGSTLLDTAAITGESMPRDIGVGDLVYSGSINKNGLFTMEVTRIYRDSTVARILDLVQNAANKKAPTEKFMTRFARVYTPAVVLVALLLAALPPLLLPGAVFSDWLYRALAFLVVSCPCALVISIPLGYFGGIGAASKNGILVKGSHYLEALTKADCVVFDKTGTLTRGSFRVSQVHSRMKSVSKEALLSLAAHAEHYSNHPIARSIVASFGPDQIAPDRIRDFSEIPGQGIAVTIDGQPVLAGSARYLADSGVAVRPADDPGTVVYIAVDGRDAGYLVIADEIKPDARQAVSRLRSLGIGHIAMLTGDTAAIGEQIGRDLGIHEVYAGLLPEQKVDHLEQIARQTPKGRNVVFVGDGINDAPVLVRADIGMSMGALGSDAAIEAADVVLMTDHPSKVADAIQIARKTKRIVWQNIVFAFAVKLAVLALSAAGMASLWGAVFADIGVALIAIFNAIRVLNHKSSLQDTPQEK